MVRERVARSLGNHNRKRELWKPERLKAGDGGASTMAEAWEYLGAYGKETEEKGS